MTFIKRLALALCLATCFSYSNAQQIDSTGNLINSNNWSGATYGVDPGGCCTSISGSGALYDTNSNTIMFSYGNDIVTNTIGLQQALGSTGVQVHGYNFSFDYRLVPNNASQASIDHLYVDVYLTTSAGQNIEYSSYDLSNATMSGLLDSWMTVSNTRTFNQPYLDPQSVSMRIQGYDGGFWAGYYGPEIKNTSLSVNYSFDPCVQDPLYSSSCPGYWDAWFQQFCLFWCSSPSEPEVEVVTVDYTMPSISSVSSMPEESTTGEVKIDAGGIEISSTGELTVPDGIPEEAREKKPVDMNLIMSIVREATDDSKALEVVNKSISDSISEESNPNFTGVSATGELIENDLITSIFLRGAFNNAGESIDSSINDEITSTSNETTSVEITSPVIAIEQNNDTEQETTVRSNLQPNDAAGDVDIASLAITPVGFNDYLTKSITEIRFYEEKEIYSGQTVVDNRRAQRLLSGASDRLHQEMVDQQYRR